MVSWSVWAICVDRFASKSTTNYICLITWFRVATNLENMENLENSGNLKNCQNLQETQGNFNFCGINLENSGKICNMIANKNALHWIFLSWVAQGKSSTYPGKLRENSGNSVFQKCGHPVIPYSLLKRTLIRGLKRPACDLLNFIHVWAFRLKEGM